MRYFLWITFGLIFPGCTVSKHPLSSRDQLKYFIVNPSIRMLDFDPLGNLYIVDSNDRLIKYDSTGHVLSNVVNNNLGQVHGLDVGNPFKTMVFYRDQQTIIIYDRTLSEMQRIHLTDWSLHDVTAACLAPDNAIWVFDG